MSTETATALLDVALQDLHAGKVAQVDRLPGIASNCSDAALVDLLQREAAQAAVQAARIRDGGVEVSGPESLWMTGILDDAERDGRETKPGRLLDIALVGAIRKAKAAEIVSSETAIALARELGAEERLGIAWANRAEEVASDRLLKERLAALAGGPD